MMRISSPALVQMHLPQCECQWQVARRTLTISQILLIRSQDNVGGRCSNIGGGWLVIGTSVPEPSSSLFSKDCCRLESHSLQGCGHKFLLNGHAQLIAVLLRWLLEIS